MIEWITLGANLRRFPLWRMAIYEALFTCPHSHWTCHFSGPEQKWCGASNQNCVRMNHSRMTHYCTKSFTWKLGQINIMSSNVLWDSINSVSDIRREMQKLKSLEIIFTVHWPSLTRSHHLRSYDRSWSSEHGKLVDTNSAEIQCLILPSHPKWHRLLQDPFGTGKIEMIRLLVEAMWKCNRRSLMDRKQLSHMNCGDLDDSFSFQDEIFVSSRNAACDDAIVSISYCGIDENVYGTTVRISVHHLADVLVQLYFLYLI